MNYVTVQKYQQQFQTQGYHFELLPLTEENIGRISRIFEALNSEFLFPVEDKEALMTYANKLLKNGYNFILSTGEEDIAITSIYANDYRTKIAFCNSFGIVPAYRGNRIVVKLVEFSLAFAKEVGMEKYRAEINKKNSRWLQFLLGYQFQIEKETDNHSYLIIKDL